MNNQGRKIAIFGWTDSVHVERWARGLMGRGYRIKVISPVEDKLDDIDSVNFPESGKLSYLKYAAAAARAARMFQPDIIHVHYAGGLGLWGLKTRIRPLIVSVWGSDIVCLPPFHNQSVEYEIANFATLDPGGPSSHHFRKPTRFFMFMQVLTVIPAMSSF